MRGFALAILLATASCAGAEAPPFHLIPGSVPLDRGPDGNSIVLDAPDGLIVVDTGRHPAHSKAILDHARERGRAIVAIINTHWHMDHTTGNADIRTIYPKAEVYQSNAVNGALKSFLADGKKNAEIRLRDPKTPPERLPEVRRFLDRMNHPESIQPTRPITASTRMKVAGRALDIHLAKFAATEGDVWLYDPETKLAIVGDLVVDIVPFMDTACADGWLKALGEIEATPFTALMPGHGSVMTRADFVTWKTAFETFVTCGRSSAPKETCVMGWETGAAQFIAKTHGDYVHEAADYYLTTRLRSSPDEQKRFCKPLGA